MNFPPSLFSRLVHSRGPQCLLLFPIHSWRPLALYFEFQRHTILGEPFQLSRSSRRGSPVIIRQPIANSVDPHDWPAVKKSSPVNWKMAGNQSTRKSSTLLSLVDFAADRLTESTGSQKTVNRAVQEMSNGTRFN